MDFNFKKIKEWFSANSNNDIRIAIVGNVSSGKSYLITDIVESLRRMKDFKGGSITRYKLKDHGVGPGGQTKVYAVRKHDFYEYKLKENNKKIQILDMPGEAFDDDDAKGTFYKLVEGLINYNGKFKKIVGKKKDKTKEGPGEVYLLSFSNIDIEKPSQDASKPDEKPSQDASKPDDTNYYSTEEMILYYSNYQFENQNVKDVSGEDVLKSFFDYDVDSLMNAIYDSNILGDDNKYFKSNMPKIYFWFYALLSTDLVYCRMIAAPDGKKGKDGNGSNIEHLYDIAMDNFSLDDDVKKNVYLVYRGADLILKQEILNNKKEEITTNLRRIKANLNRKEFIHDGVYSEISYNLLEYLNNDNDEIALPAGINITGVMLNDGQDFAVVDEDGFRAALNDQIYGFYNHFYDKNNGFANYDVCPYVFFTTSAIDKNYNIHRNVMVENILKFDKNGLEINDNVSNRLCFGTRQLLLCILKNYIQPSDLDVLKEFNKKFLGKKVDGEQKPFTEKLFSMLGYETNND